MILSSSSVGILNSPMYLAYCDIYFKIHPSTVIYMMRRTTKAFKKINTQFSEIQMISANLRSFFDDLMLVVEIIFH